MTAGRTKRRKIWWTLGFLLLLIIAIDRLFAAFFQSIEETGRPLHAESRDAQVGFFKPHSASTFRLLPWTGLSHIEIDNLGFRGMKGIDKPLKPAAGVVRILTLGDSFTFGLGVEYQDTWPAQLAARLNKTRPGAFEVINAGNLGMSFNEHPENLKRFSEQLEPQLVILQLLGDDTTPYHPEHAPESAGGFKRAYQILEPIMAFNESLDWVAKRFGEICVYAKSHQLPLFVWATDVAEDQLEVLRKVAHENGIPFYYVDHDNIPRLPWDGHPTPQGYAMILDDLEPQLKPMIESLTVRSRDETIGSR